MVNKMIEVRTTKEAWNVADRLFPTDYIKDEGSTSRAGYPIYKSTAEENDSWISDLGCTLELNIWKNKKVETTRIVINPMPKIVAHRFMKQDEIRNMCVANDWYTCGTVKEFSELMDLVENCGEPTDEKIYQVAKNIYDHSDKEEEPVGQMTYRGEYLTIEHIMDTIANEVVKTIYVFK